ncbi:MAG: hypothetical protein MZV64_09325 [Ignavibacteriales bacterium]|nr:hypothetical protein [Ignavibacteriales bacterium]
MVRLRDRTASHLLSSGKVQELIRVAQAEDADSIIFDHPLSPVQQRNWEEDSDRARVYDRSELILKIFAARALTREAGLQVELAQLQYALPRLAHSREDLMPAEGRALRHEGIRASRRPGAGPAQDRGAYPGHPGRSRRRCGKTRARPAQAPGDGRACPGPRSSATPTPGSPASSTPSRDADALAEDKLFATLDPTTRRITLRPGQGAPGHGHRRLRAKPSARPGGGLQGHPGGGRPGRRPDPRGGRLRPRVGTPDGDHGGGARRDRRGGQAQALLAFNKVDLVADQERLGSWPNGTRTLCSCPSRPERAFRSCCPGWRIS